MGELPFNYVMNVDDILSTRGHSATVRNSPVWNATNTTTSRAEHVKVNK